MSSRKRTVSLSPDARIDFTDILLYTRQEWGEEQRDRYEAALVHAMANLADYPDLGERRPGLFSGCHAHVVGRHVLYYRITDDTIEVVRILHERADPTRHLQP
jgi:toxin ParE1/3/4